MSKTKRRSGRHTSAGTGTDSAVSKGPGPRVIAAKLLARWQALKSEKRPALNTLIQEAAAGIPVQETRYPARTGEHAGSGKASEDRALMGEIVTGSIRWLRLLTLLSDSRLKRPDKVPPVVKSILVSAIYQLLFLDRVPAFAVVNEAVKAARSCGASWATGLVNAVLRGIVRDMQSLGRDGLTERAAKGAGSAAEAMATAMSYPTWMVKMWMEQFGMEAAQAMCLAGNSRPPVTLRVNRLKVSRSLSAEMLRDSGIEALTSEISPDGLILPGFRGNPAAIPGFDKGMFQVQDESAQLVSLLLDCQAGQRILDACAGPGGKTTHIAENTGDQAHIDAYDISGRRLGLLKENARRLGHSSIHVLKKQEFDSMRQCGEPVYHRILVDAPCSGLGVIRRHPDIKWNRSPEDIRRLAEIQGSILKETAPLLKHGGIMAYAVCTTTHEETVEVVQKFLKQHASWQALRADRVMPGLHRRFLIDEGYLRILPVPDGPDGFFAALFTRNMH